MIKQSWVVSDDEKRRIISLHENATKRQYLIKEQDTESESLIQNNVPKNINFRFPLKNFNIPESIECKTDDKGNVFYLSNGEEYKLPTIQEIKLPTFWFTPDGFLEGVDDWEWVNGFNDIVVARNNQRRYLYIPSYDKSNLSLHFLFYDLVDITKRDAKKKREADDYLQLGDDKYIRFGNRFLVVVGDDLPTGGNMPTSGDTIPSTPIETSEEIPINLDIARPFVFDSTELTDEAKPIFEKFIKDVSEKYKGVTANVDVITSSSVDGDPSETLNSGITRGQYDMNLSQRRAQAIADILNNRVGISTLKFIPRGIGQTTQFGPGWTREKPTTPEETEPNRRLIINLPRLTKKIPK